jgi:hypothetical protein
MRAELNQTESNEPQPYLTNSYGPNPTFSFLKGYKAACQQFWHGGHVSAQEPVDKFNDVVTT